ncbi:histone deacetylase 7 isoform X2 [Gadus macrocephalus]|nr:histone deacetylase 7 isoform X2 [Gadus macrocephalus]
MDLRVSQRLVRPGLDANMLAPPHTLFLGHFSSEPFPRISPSHVEVQYNNEPSPAEMDTREEIRQLMHKSKNEQSAVASPLVKQKLRERLMRKVAQERSSPSHNCHTPQGYRELGPDPDMPPKPKPSLSDQRQNLGIRRTVSEPTLKLKLKKHINTRQSPLQRKASAPPTVKHRTHDAFDSSPNSSTSVSGCSSPNDSLLSDTGTRPLNTGLVHEANRLLLQNGSLAHFSMASGSTGMPTITAGLPAQVDRHQGGLMGPRGLQVSALPHIYLPLEGLNPALAQRLQPVLVLEPHTGMLHTQLLSVHGLSALPQQLQQQLRPHQLLLPSEGGGGGGGGGGDDGRCEEGPASHRPLIRTRSEPPPYSHSPLASPGLAEGPQHQRLLQQYHNSLLLERLKHHAHLGKLIPKPSEKPRLTQIPSEDMDLEETGSGSGSGPGSLCGSEPGSLGEERHLQRRQSAASTDSVYDTESNASSRESLAEHPTALAQTMRWEPHRQAVMRRPVAQLEPLALPVLMGPHHRPLSRAQSSPAATSTPPALLAALPLASPESPVKLRFTTGLVYDTQMQKHQCACGDNSRHPEHAGRVQSIWSRLRGLRQLCEPLRSRKATLEELQSVHSETHVVLYGTNPLNRFKLDSNKLAAILSQRRLVMLPCGGVGTDSDTIWNEMHTATASRLAAGCVTDLALKVAQGELKNGFAVVRPPGHHATHSAPMGFCFFNTVAIAAKQLRLKLNVSKILIVDWDVHHGNGTQEAFYNDPNVLYISLHRYDNGNFFPGSGGPTEMGADKGEGFNVNVAWTGGLDPPMGDVEYLAAFRTVVMPIAHEFSPDMVLVSSGFDAVQGHSPKQGGYKVSAKCFGFLTRQLMSLAGGRVVLALEGGHDLTAICDASEACVSTLLGIEVEPLPQSVLDGRPCDNAILSLQRVIQVHGEYWQSVRSMAPTLELSHLQAQRVRPRRDSDSDPLNAMASLSMGVRSPHR